MARGVNKVIIVGNLGKDPDVRHMPSGGAVANLTIATSEQWLDKQSGEKTEKTEWHRVVMFGRLGEIAGEYLRKGSKVYVEGRLQTRSYEDKDGKKVWATDVVAYEVILLGGRGQGGQAGGAGATMDEGFGQESGGGAPVRSAPRARPAQTQAPAPSNDGITDDDVPF